jgi:hypothetical protein
MMKDSFLFLLLMVGVSLGYAQPAFDQRPLEEALNPDGTLKPDVQGSFKVQGYEMRTGKHGEPIFLPKMQNPTTGTWSALGSGSGNGVNNYVYAIAVSDSEVYVGGLFSLANVGGTTVSVNNIARFNLNTNTWSALSSGSGNGVNNYVFAIALSGSDVYVGGLFTAANVGGTTVSANRIARFNTTTNTWSTLSSGSGNGVNAQVFALAVSGSDVYVGGGFTQANVGGTTVPANYIVRFNTTTNTWSALGSGSGNGVNNTVSAIAVSDSEVYVGGAFIQANVGGTTVSVNNIARFNTTTNTWSALGSGSGSGVNINVNALAVSGSDVYVGGYFTQANVGGTTVSANRIARFNLNTNTWSALGSGSGNGVSGPVFALAVSGSDVYVGGLFSQANVGGTTVSVNNIARFNTTTNTWSALGSGSGNGVDGQVLALAVSGSDVYVGGGFTQANVRSTIVPANHVARWNSGATSVERIGDDIPTTYLLSQNYPNPFNPSTTISFSIPTSEFVTLKVYDVLGREVATLVNEQLRAGSYSYNFTASNLTSGVYLYKLQAGKYSETKKMVLTK